MYKKVSVHRYFIAFSRQFYSYIFGFVHLLFIMFCNNYVNIYKSDISF